jgi:hypothetical protein
MSQYLLNELFLIKDFQSNDKFGLLLTSQKNLSELAMAQCFPQFKIINSPLRRRGGFEATRVSN